MAVTSSRTCAALAAALTLACAPACVGSQADTTGTTPDRPETETPEPAGDGSGSLEGEYVCNLTIGGEEYRDATCEIGPGDLPDTLWLEKREGSQRLSGEVVPTADGGFEFHGYYMCPQGACDENVDATFRQVEPGAYEAAIETSQGEVTVSLVRE